MDRPLIYLSLDIKTDGPYPGSNSMIEIGIVAVQLTGQIIDYFRNFYRPCPIRNQTLIPRKLLLKKLKVRFMRTLSLL